MSAPVQTTSRQRIAWRLLWLVLPLLGAGYQTAAKSVATGQPGAGSALAWLAAMALQPWTWVMLALEIASFFIWLQVLAQIKLSEAFPLSAVSYVLVIAAGWGLFHEPISGVQVAGGLAILAGVWLIGSGRAEAG